MTEQDFANRWGFQPAKGYGSALFDCRENLLKDLDAVIADEVKNLALPHVSGSLLLRSDEICLLEKYSLWLTKNGYMDTDWKDEEPFAIDEFLKSNDR